MLLPRQSLREQVRDALLRDILHGVYQPGDRLVEMKIARDLGTSQSPVREALRELEALGFVASARHRGTVVGDVWKRGLREIYAVRGGLEELATRLATPALAGDVSALQAEVDAMREAARAGNVDGLVTHSYRFHRAIIEASANHLLLSVWQGLQIETRTTITMMAPGIDLQEAAECHQPIVDAIASGDVELACRVTREHQEFFERLPLPVAELPPDCRERDGRDPQPA
ncbi:MAG: GntR family transcriptional regulator [Thermomicrobiales bacterium]|nr:GntR family transcriptional regulator [Thermomicrobiales bacterium]